MAGGKVIISLVVERTECWALNRTRQNLRRDQWQARLGTCQLHAGNAIRSAVESGLYFAACSFPVSLLFVEYF